MLALFPTPYPNEFFSSIVTRYHQRSGNASCRFTLSELFGSETASAISVFPSNLEHLCSQLHPDSMLTPDLFIWDHSLFSMYKPFLQQERSKLALQRMKAPSVGKGGHWKARGMLRYNLFTERSLKYCPQCFVVDKRQYGEAYWHRDHQHFGVLTCYKHRSLLVDTGIPLASRQNGRQFHLLDREYPPKSAERPCLEEHEDHLNFVADAVHCLLNNKVPDDSMDVLYGNYRRILILKRFAHRSSIMSHSRVSKAFLRFYGSEFLDLMSSLFPSPDKMNWLVELLKNPTMVTDPLRHILTIRFLGGEVQNMLLHRQ